MRSIGAAVLCVVLSGGCASAQNATPPTQAGNHQFVGQNVQVIADRFGLPAGRKKMDNDEMLYVLWGSVTPDQSAKKRTTTAVTEVAMTTGRTSLPMTERPPHLPTHRHGLA